MVLSETSFFGLSLGSGLERCVLLGLWGSWYSCFNSPVFTPSSYTHLPHLLMSPSGSLRILASSFPVHPAPHPWVWASASSALGLRSIPHSSEACFSLFCLIITTPSSTLLFWLLQVFFPFVFISCFGREGRQKHVFSQLS